MGVLVRQRALWILVLAWGPLPALAQQGDTFRTYVSYLHTWDSNLYRLAKSEYGLVADRSDDYGVLAAGLEMDWRPARQQIMMHVGGSAVRFSRNTQLDYDGSDFRANWNWRLGNRWSGNVGATQALTQSSFNDLGVPINNRVTRDSRFFSTDWQFHPRWQAGAGVSALESTNSEAVQALLDYEEISYNATIGYVTPKGSRLRLQFRRLDGEYPGRTAAFQNRAYAQDEINVLGDWSIAGKLVAHGRIGYLNREDDAVPERNSARLAGRLSVEYTPTGRTALRWEVYREVANSDDIRASHQVSAGTTFGLAWQATPKITLRANVGWENRRFDGDTGVLPTAARRDEDTASGSLSLRYAPMDMATIDLGVQAGRRESSLPNNDYSFHALFASGRIGF